MLFALLLARFAMPLVTVGSDAVFQRFLQDDYTTSQMAIEANHEELEILTHTSDESIPKKGVMDRAKAWLHKISPSEGLRKIKQVASQVTEHIVKIIVVFVMQTLVIPLLLFWAFYKGGKAVVFSRSPAT